ncbi:unnamed protein product [Psylliodes chrysocephalus]|uniref:Uncharacterized protein n=1 Tax=Psylliodes chrysocephalus TaxID=3402493 RepID=A0A9P0GMX2_9CUCU|nr:unnamed protein product [Psylliodes chrysocephala]
MKEFSRLVEDFAFKILKTKDYAKMFLWIPKVMFRQIFMWPKQKTYSIKSFFFCLISISLTIFSLIGMVNDLEYDFGTKHINTFNIVIQIGYLQVGNLFFFIINV